MADIAVTAANVKVATSTAAGTGWAGEAIAAGKVVFLADNSKVMLADSNGVDPDAHEAIAIALNSAAVDQPVSYVKRGLLTLGGGLVAGTSYFLSDTPGGICPDADVGTGESVCLLGIAKSTTVLAVDIAFPNVTR